MSQQTLSRHFKGIWIPAEIWLCQDLSVMEKMLWAEINSLSSKEKGCYASNQHLANFCGISVRQIQSLLANMESLGWIIKQVSCLEERTLMCVQSKEVVKIINRGGEENFMGGVLKTSPLIYTEGKETERQEDRTLASSAPVVVSASQETHYPLLDKFPALSLADKQHLSKSYPESIISDVAECAIDSQPRNLMGFFITGCQRKYKPPRPSSFESQSSAIKENSLLEANETFYYNLAYSDVAKKFYPRKIGNKVSFGEQTFDLNDPNFVKKINQFIQGA